MDKIVNIWTCRINQGGRKPEAEELSWKLLREEPQILSIGFLDLFDHPMDSWDELNEKYNRVPWVTTLHKQSANYYRDALKQFLSMSMGDIVIVPHPEKFNNKLFSVYELISPVFSRSAIKDQRERFLSWTDENFSILLQDNIDINFMYRVRPICLDRQRIDLPEEVRSLINEGFERRKTIHAITHFLEALKKSRIL